MEEMIHRFTAEAAALGVGEADEARNAGGATEARCIQPFGREPGDLGGAEARRQDEPDAFGGEAAGVEAESGESGRGGRLFGPGDGGGLHYGKRETIGRGAGAQVGELRGIRLPPVAPDRDLRVAGVFALGLLAGGGGDQGLKRIGCDGLHRLAVEIAAGVDVHFVDQQLVPARGRRDLQRGHERKVGDRAVAGDEEDQVAARADLAGDAFEVVARAVHEREARVGEVAQRLRVVDDRVEARARVLLVDGAERFERDVVEAAEPVAGGRIALGGEPVPRELRAEAVDLADERAGGGEVADVAEQVVLGAHGFVGLGQDAGAAVADGLVHERAGEGISGYAGECIGATALQGDTQPAQRLRGAGQRGHLR